MSSRVLCIVATVAVVCALPATASAGFVFQFAPTNPRAGTKYIEVRAVPTPADYHGVRLPDSASVVDLYLVRHADAPTVHSIDDSRLIPLGRYDPVHVSTKYRLPRLDTATYAMAAQCLDCKTHELFVIGVGPSLSGVEALMLLHATATPRFPIWPFMLVALLLLLLVLTARAVVSRKRGVRSIGRSAALAARATPRTVGL
jgi:hypothetical protein